MFTRFGSMVDARTRKLIEHGRRIRAVLAQQQFAPLSLGEQVALLCAVADGVLDPVPLDRIGAFRAGLAGWLKNQCPEVLALGDDAKPLPDALRARLTASLAGLAQTLGAASAAEEPA